jgi:hypothetical protein
MPILGDTSEGIVTGMIYAIPKSKRSTLLKLIEFVPAYTISTLLLWIYSESKNMRKQAVVQ